MLVCNAGNWARVCSAAARACSASSEVTRPACSRHCVICSVSSWLARLSFGDRQPLPARREARCSSAPPRRRSTPARRPGSRRWPGSRPRCASRALRLAPKTSSSQLASSAALKLLPASCRLPTCCAAPMPKRRPRAAARPPTTSRSARAWRNAACAPLTLVLACRAWATRRASSGSSKRNHHCASDDVPAGADTSATDQAAGTSISRGGALRCDKPAQPDRASITEVAMAGTRARNARVPRRAVRKAGIALRGMDQEEPGCNGIRRPSWLRAIKLRWARFAITCAARGTFA